MLIGALSAGVAPVAAKERPILRGAEYEGWIWWLLLNGLLDVLLAAVLVIGVALVIRGFRRAIAQRRMRHGSQAAALHVSKTRSVRDQVKCDEASPESRDRTNR